MQKINSIFSGQKHWVLDGGMGSALEKKGFDLNHPLWSAKVLSEDPQAIYEVHKDFLRAGAEVILTASYQASIEGFIKHLGMYRAEAEAVLRFTVEIACRAREDFRQESGVGPKAKPILIGASVGPYGAVLADRSEYHGGYDVSTTAVGDYYAHKIEHLILPRRNVKADFLAFETVPTRKEADLILVVLKTIPWAQAWITFSRPEALIEALPLLEKNPQVVALGLNCVTTTQVDEFLPQVRARTAKPIVVYPNGKDAGDWGLHMRRWMEQGANLLGGCCGTGREEIAAIAARVQENTSLGL